MPRKATLTGGRRDEIIRAAMELFFEHGYEGTSVRMITDRTGGEIGMFYHYFKSKDELFDQVVSTFFSDYEKRFAAVIAHCTTPEELIDAFLPLYTASMAQFAALCGRMHWTIQYALHARTLEALLPAVRAQTEALAPASPLPADILAGQLLYGVSATLHSPRFDEMTPARQRECLLAFVRGVLDQR